MRATSARRCEARSTDGLIRLIRVHSKKEEDEPGSKRERTRIAGVKKVQPILTTFQSFPSPFFSIFLLCPIIPHSDALASSPRNSLPTHGGASPQNKNTAHQEKIGREGQIIRSARGLGERWRERAYLCRNVCVCARLRGCYAD